MFWHGSQKNGRCRKYTFAPARRPWDVRSLDKLKEIPGVDEEDLSV